MNDDERKRIGQDFIHRLRSKCEDKNELELALKEFASDSSENRAAVAMGLLIIGSDRSETIYYRNFVLSQLALLIRTCGLRNNKELEGQLSSLIDDWIVSLPNQGVHTAPCGALLALGRVNQRAGLEKCDHVITYYNKSEAGLRVCELRKDIEQLNSLEN